MSNNITKEGIEVRVGQVWTDLDQRQQGRKCRVLAVEAGKAVMQSSSGYGQKTRVSIARMHKHSTGWALVG